jgi:RNA polymerase sigma-70 factor (ECF subfamily)
VGPPTPNPQQVPEVEVRRAYHEHHAWAFAELWRRHQPALQRRAATLAGQDVHLAEDALQDLGARLAQAETQDAYDPNRPWLPWAGTILHNLLVTSLRQRARQDIQSAPDVSLDELSGRGPTPDEAVAQSENHARLSQALKSCLEELSQELREVLQSYEVDGLTQAEIAARQGVATSTVCKHLAKARELMRACLEKKLGGEP